MICWMPLGCPGRHIIMSSAEPTKSKNETPIYRLKLFHFQREQEAIWRKKGTSGASEPWLSGKS